MKRSYRRLPSIRNLALVGILLIAAWPQTQAVYAQAAADSLSATVTRVQSRGIYVEVGSSLWVVGDTLRVIPNSGEEGISKIAGKASNSLLLAWIGAPIALEVGERVLLRGPKVLGGKAAEPDVVAQSDRKGLVNGNEGRLPVAKASKRSIVLRGYYNASITATMSDVRSSFSNSGSASTTRSYATPVSSLRASLAGLPFGTELRLNARGSTRFSSESIVGQKSAVRVYEFNLSRHARDSRFEFELGRFQSSRIPTGGYWDGLSTSVRFGALRFGLAGGFEPDRYNEGFQTDITKVAAFSEIDARHGDGSTSLSASLAQIDGPGLSSPYTFLSIDQRTRIGKHRFSTDLQIDRSPIDQQIVLSRAYFRLNTTVSPGLSLNGRFGTRKHFSYWFPGGAYSSEKQQISVGMMLQRTINQYGLTLTSNSFSGGERSNSVSATFRSKPKWLPFTFSNTANVWTRKNGNTYYNAINMQKNIGRWSLGLDYSLLAVDVVGPLSLSHIAGVSARISTDHWGYFSIRQRTHIGSSITSATLFFNYGISF
ncbi:hypothetical protein HQ496_00115 [bacterium]|nr:hypothetical protein [bacterium]